MHGAIPLLPNMPSWHDAQLRKRHRDNFTFTFTLTYLIQFILNELYPFCLQPVIFKCNIVISGRRWGPNKVMVQTAAVPCTRDGCLEETTQCPGKYHD
jgi:hypothetical protein